MPLRLFRRPLVLVALLAATGTGFAASGAKYAGEFLAIGVGGRALGLGGAYAALAGDVTAAYWNPAGLARIGYPQLTVMHDERFAGLINYDYGAVAWPMGAQATLAASVIRLGVDNIANTRDAWVDENGNGQVESSEVDYSRISYFNVADWGLYLSYAKRAGERLSVGANVKIIRRDLADASATGIGFDVGLNYRVDDRLTVGLNAQDITTTLVAWSTGRNELITPTLKLGSAYALEALEGRIIPAFDMDVRFENRQSASNLHVGGVSVDFHEGLEYSFRDVVAVRFGYSDIGSLTLGTGIHLPKFDIDYSFSKFNADDQLGNTHRISLTFTLQGEQFARSGE